MASSMPANMATSSTGVSSVFAVAFGSEVEVLSLESLTDIWLVFSRFCKFFDAEVFFFLAHRTEFHGLEASIPGHT